MNFKFFTIKINQWCIEFRDVHIPIHCHLKYLFPNIPVEEYETIGLYVDLETQMCILYKWFDAYELKFNYQMKKIIIKL